MKKIIGILMIAVCFTVITPVRAQFHFGLKGGLDFSRIHLSGGAPYQGRDRTGWFLGPMAEFTVPIIGIGLDVAALYSQNTLAVNQSSAPTAKLKTVEIPVNLKWSVGFGSLFGVYVALGPQFGYNVGNKWLKKYELEKSNTSFNVGAGLKLIKHIQVGANYNFALGHTAIYIPGSNINFYKVKNNSWQASLAYLF